MKITFAYLPEEQEEAAACVTAIRQLQPCLKVRKSDAHPPFKHIYLNMKKPQIRARDVENCKGCNHN